VPLKWTIETENMDGTWAAARNPSGFGVEKDTANRVTFTPSLTHAVRVRVWLREGRSAGILRFSALGKGY